MVTVTFAHHSLIQGNRAGVLYGLIATLVLAVVFTIFQGVEYSVSSFTISDGAFGSCFYFSTGFHGWGDMLSLSFDFYLPPPLIYIKINKWYIYIIYYI